MTLAETDGGSDGHKHAELRITPRSDMWQGSPLHTHRPLTSSPRSLPGHHSRGFQEQRSHTEITQDTYHEYLHLWTRDRENVLGSPWQAGYTPQTSTYATPDGNSLVSKLHQQPFTQLAIYKLVLLKCAWQQYQKKKPEAFFFTPFTPFRDSLAPVAPPVHYSKC